MNAKNLRYVSLEAQLISVCLLCVRAQAREMSLLFMASPPLMASTNDSSPGSQVEYTFNSKVMVAAMVILFVVVLFVVSLHIYAKWFWHQGTAASRWSTANALNASWHRRRRRLELVTDESMATNACTGLDPSTVDSLPTFTYEEAMQEAEPLLECAVCLSEFQVLDKGRILPNCKHSFHIDCIDTWFHSHSTCPLCRTPILPPTTHDSQDAGNSSIHGPPFFQHTLSSTAHQRHADEAQTTSASGSADPREPLPLLQSMPGVESHPQQEEGPANSAGHKAPMLHLLIPLASMPCAHIPSFGELLCKDDIPQASLPRMGASGSSSARAMPTEILRQQERAAIARSTSLSLSIGLSEDVQVCSPQPQKSLSFRMSIKRLVSRELSKGRSRVFPSGQVNAESEQSTSVMDLPV